MNPSNTTDLQIESSKIKHLSAISIRFIVLVLFLIIAFIENFFLLLLTIGPVSKWIRGRKENKCFLANTPALSRRQSELNQRKARNSYDSLKQITSQEWLQSAVNRESRHQIIPISMEHCYMEEYSKYSTARFTRYYFGNLCLANLLLVLVALPGTLLVCFGINQDSDSPSNEENLSDEAMRPHSFLSSQKMSSVFCISIELSVVSLAFAIIFCLVQLTADRLLAVCCPFQYPRIMTQVRAFLNITAGWVFALLLGIMPHLVEWFHKEENVSCSEPTINMEDVFKCFIFGQHSQHGHKYFVLFYFTLAYLIPVIFMIFAYIIMYHKARLLSKRSQSLQIKQETPCNTYQQEGRSCPDGNIHISNDDRKKRSSSVSSRNNNSLNAIGENKAAFRAFWLVATFLSLTLPYFGLMLKSGIKNFNYSNSKSLDESLPTEQGDQIDHSEKDMEEVIRSICVWLLYVNATITPGIYAYTDRILRKRFLYFFAYDKIRGVKNKNDRITSPRQLKSGKSMSSQSTTPERKNFISVV